MLFGELDPKDFARIVSVQTLSGSGALKLAGEVLFKACGIKKIAISDPTWSNHQQMFPDMNYEVSK